VNDRWYDCSSDPAHASEVDDHDVMDLDWAELEDINVHFALLRIMSCLD